MKRLSDYEGDEAIELWADLLEPIVSILGDKKVAEIYRSGKSKIEIAKLILKEHKESAVEILTRIDDTPINGVNLVVRVVDVLLEIENSPELKDFFEQSGQAKKDGESFGSATENTKDGEN